MADHDIEIPSDMTPWYGNKKGPPEDWDPNWKVLHRGDGTPFMGSVNTSSSSYWDWDPSCPDLDILAYHSTQRQNPRQG